jgi:glycosyltransferase involved in cell wall biosynthesis
LVRTLAELPGLRQPEAAWELLIVDNASRDGTAELLARHAWPEGWRVRVVREEKLGLSNARNRAIADARGDHLLFLDDDETPDPDWLRAYERLIRTRDPDAFGSRIEVAFEDTRPAWLTDELLGFLGELDRADAIVPLHERGTSFHGGNFGFHRRVVPVVGDFDATLGRKGTDNTGGEEVDFYRRLLDAGLKVWWTPEAKIYHRIQAAKLTRGYFLDLHYRQGRMEGLRRRGAGSRIPPRYLFGQLSRAMTAVWRQLRASGRDATLRREMNVAYFAGHILGWVLGPR